MRSKKFFGLIFLLLMTSAQPSPQQSGQQKPPSPEPEPAAETSPRIGRSGPSSLGPLYLSGSVVLAEGDLPVSSAKVELLCHGTVRSQTYTDTNGNFSIRLGDRLQSSVGDASISRPAVGLEQASTSRSGGQGGVEYYRETPGGDFDLRGCELRAAVPRLRSSTIQLGIRGTTHDPNVGALILENLSPAGGKGSVISVKSLAAPKAAREALESARKLLDDEKGGAKAIRRLEEAVEIYPDFAEAWELLGTTYRELGKERESNRALREAIKVDPRYVPPYFSLAENAINRGRWKEVLRLSSELLEMEPNLIRARYLYANSSFFLGELATAEREALLVKESAEGNLYPAVHYILGTALAERGEWQSARVEFTRFLEVNPEAPVADGLRRQLDIWAEQGMFDPKEER